MYKAHRRYKRSTNIRAVSKTYYIPLNQNDLEMLIKLLEFSNMELLRTFKKFGSEDFDLKEIYWNYRYNCNEIRKNLIKCKT